MKKVCDFIARWMGVLVLLTAVGALLCPAPLGTIDTWYINPFIGLIMFGMGLTLSAHDFRVVLAVWLSLPSCPSWRGCYRCFSHFPKNWLLV